MEHSIYGEVLFLILPYFNLNISKVFPARLAVEIYLQREFFVADEGGLFILNM